MKKGKGLDPELIYQAAHKRNWRECIAQLHTYRSEFPVNPVARRAAQIVVEEFLKDVETNEKGNYEDELYRLHQLHVSKFITLGSAELIKLLEHLLKLLEEKNPKEAYTLARQHADVAIAAEFINKYLESQPRRISHSQEDLIDAVENVNIQAADYSIPLFKSKQERDFFIAVRDCFPNFHTYPNVAISSLLDFNELKSKLSDKQGDYFLKAIIDCVVFNPESYKPIYFFEVDSEFHDSPDRQKKDAWKNLFFSLAGKKLLRVRPTARNVEQEQFKKLIKECMKESGL